jgi:AGZA family xanthine/uracil permease-like MFS transporter
MDNVLSAAGTSAAKVGEPALESAGVVYQGLHLLGDGAILAGLVLGAITAFLIDKKFWWAAGYAAAGAVLSFVGLIHADQVGWNAGGGQVALGYLFFAVVCAAFAVFHRDPASGAGQPAAPDLIDAASAS